VAAPVYSTRLLQAQGLAGTISYTVPAGYILILRDLDVYCHATGVDHVLLIGAAGQAIWHQEFDATTTFYGSWRGRQVLYETETVQIAANMSILDSADVTLSGYLLTAP